MHKRTSLTVIVPALNEQANLAATLSMIGQVAPRFFDDYEVIVINDGSTDATGSIADALARNDGRLRVVHHTSPHNLGGCYREGVALAQKEFVIMIPGDNECGEEVLAPVLQETGRADIVIPFTANPEVRPIARRLLSSTFVAVLNFASGKRLRYYNGTVLHRAALLKSCAFSTDGFGYQAEILVKLLGAGATFVEVPTKIRNRPAGRSKAFRLKNLLQVARCLASIASAR